MRINSEKVKKSDTIWRQNDAHGLNLEKILYRGYKRMSWIMDDRNTCLFCCRNTLLCGESSLLTAFGTFDLTLR